MEWSGLVIGGGQIGDWWWRPDRRLVVAARSVVKIGIELGALGDEIGGLI